MIFSCLFWIDKTHFHYHYNMNNFITHPMVFVFALAVVKLLELYETWLLLWFITIAIFIVTYSHTIITAPSLILARPLWQLLRLSQSDFFSMSMILNDHLFSFYTFNFYSLSYWLRFQKCQSSSQCWQQLQLHHSQTRLLLAFKFQCPPWLHQSFHHTHHGIVNRYHQNWQDHE